jgi:fumarate reductase subunit C
MVSKYHQRMFVYWQQDRPTYKGYEMLDLIHLILIIDAILIFGWLCYKVKERGCL